MKIKTGVCITENCSHCRNRPDTPLISKRCKNSYWQFRAGLKEPKPAQQRKPIKQISDKRARILRAYHVLRLKFLQDRPNCGAKLRGCTIKATDIHHKEGRVGSKMLNTRTWLQLCRNCHQIIELNPDWAKENGFSTSRLQAEQGGEILFTLAELTLNYGSETAGKSNNVPNAINSEWETND